VDCQALSAIVSRSNLPTDAHARAVPEELLDELLLELRWQQGDPGERVCKAVDESIAGVVIEGGGDQLGKSGEGVALRLG